jgi:hypothetical protein
MIRSFPIFPGDAPGAALLLMRAATAATLLLSAHHGLITGPWPASAIILLAVGLVAGLFTRAIAAVGALLLAGLAVLIGSTAGALLALLGAQALALMLLGGGAYSCDARLFGRRVIRLDDTTGDRDDPTG